MEKALQDRLREALSGVVGKVHFAPDNQPSYDRPAVDWSERKSNAKTAFPALVLTTVSPGRDYYQGGTDGLTRPRIRAEIFDRTPLSVKATKDALIAEMEREATFGGVRFNRAQLAFERDADPEDLAGGLRLFRTILDFFVPNSPAQGTD